MGFEKEYASYEPLRRILSSEKVKMLQDRLRLRERSQDDSERESDENLIVRKLDLLPSQFRPDFIIAIDGSYQSVPIINGFPGAELGYITLASVLISQDLVRRLADEDIIDPKKFRDTERASTIETVVPGCNVVLSGERSPKSSMRRILFEELKQNTVFTGGESLLETYEELLKIKIEEEERRRGVRRPQSPIEDVDQDMTYGYGEYECQHSGMPLYSTDATRLHELLNPSGTCGEMYGQIMSMLEKLWLVHILRAFEDRDWLDVLQRVAFVMDGPLACFSTWSWLNKPIIKEIRRINRKYKEKCGGEDLLIIGIEKSGTFFEHFKALDTSPSGAPGQFPACAAFLLTDDYIKKNIIFSQSNKLYGEDTYFGRKIFYKTMNGYMIVVVVATFSDYQQDLTTANLDQFPRMYDLMDHIDSMVSSRYPNSISPLISAHAEAAVPLNLGRRIFDKIAQEIRESSCRQS